MNGNDLELDGIWEDVPHEQMTIKDKAVKDSFHHISTQWKDLQCKKHHKAIEWLQRGMWILIGMGIIITTLLLPMLFKFGDLIFRNKVVAESNNERVEDVE